MPALALHNPNEMGSGLYDVRASTPKSLSTTPTKPAKKLSNIPKHNLDKDRTYLESLKLRNNLSTFENNSDQEGCFCINVCVIDIILIV